MIFASRKLNDRYACKAGTPLLFTLLISPGNVAIFSEIRNVDLTLCLCLGTSEYTTNFQLRLKPFATRGKVVADKGKLLFSLVFTVRGNSAISFANVEVNRTRLPVLGESLRKSLPWSRICPFIFVPGSGRFGYFSKDCDKFQDASQFSAAFDIRGNSQMGLAAVLSVVTGRRW